MAVVSTAADRLDSSTNLQHNFVGNLWFIRMLAKSILRFVLGRWVKFTSKN